MVTLRLINADSSFTAMSYPHLLFDCWESSFLWIVWSCHAVLLSRFNMDGMAFLFEVSAEGDDGFAFHGLVVHVAITEHLLSA